MSDWCVFMASVDKACTDRRATAGVTGSGVDGIAFFDRLETSAVEGVGAWEAVLNSLSLFVTEQFDLGCGIHWALQRQPAIGDDRLSRHPIHFEN